MSVALYAGVMHVTMLEREDGTRIAVELSEVVRGSAAIPVTVLLHGLGGTRAELRELAHGLPGRSALVDLRGHGASSRRPADLEPAAFVEDLHAVVEYLGGMPVALVGQSFGGHIALRYAARHPDLIVKLVLIEAGVGGEGVEAADRIADWFASWPQPFIDPESAIERLGSSPFARAAARALVPTDGGWSAPFDPEVLRAALRAISREPAWDAWRGVEAPTLLITGGHGAMAEAEVGRMIAMKPVASRAIVPEAGHEVHLDAPATTLRVTRSFLAPDLPDAGPVTPPL